MPNLFLKLRSAVQRAVHLSSTSRLPGGDPESSYSQPCVSIVKKTKFVIPKCVFLHFRPVLDTTQCGWNWLTWRTIFWTHLMTFRDRLDAYRTWDLLPTACVVVVCNWLSAVLEPRPWPNRYVGSGPPYKEGIECRWLACPTWGR